MTLWWRNLAETILTPPIIRHINVMNPVIDDALRIIVFHGILTLPENLSPIMKKHQANSNS